MEASRESDCTIGDDSQMTWRNSKEQHAYKFKEEHQKVVQILVLLVREKGITVVVWMRPAKGCTSNR